MDVSRFIFKQETKDKLQEETRLSAGKARWEKLKELEANGKLATAKDRRDIVELLGYDRQNLAVYYWVSDKIKKHYLVEQLTDVADERQYYTTGEEPDYDAHSQAMKMWEGRKAKAKQPKEEQPREEQPREEQPKKQTRRPTCYFNMTRLTRLNAIKQLQDSGEIAKITTRRELCNAIKVPYDTARGWSHYMIKSGLINEADPWETPRYSLTQKALKEMSIPIKAVEANHQPATTTDITVATEQSGLTMVVHYGDLTIEFKGITQETINSLIAKLANKTN